RSPTAACCSSMSSRSSPVRRSRPFASPWRTVAYRSFALDTRRSTPRGSCCEAELAPPRRRLSGPLLDRLDLLVALHRETTSEERLGSLESSEQARRRVLDARERQRSRLRAHGIGLNAEMDARALREHVRLDGRGETMVSRARRRGLLSARGESRLLRVARTIADLDGVDRVRARDIGAALALRPYATDTERSVA